MKTNPFINHHTVATRFLNGLCCLCLCLGFSSCTQSRHALTAGLGAGAGGFAGNYLAPEGASLQKRALYAGGGALAGGLLASGYSAWNENSEITARTEGYEKGQSDAVRRQYWIMQQAQALPPPSGREERDNRPVGTGTPRLYEIPVPEYTTADGVIKAETMRVLPVVE